MQKFAIEDFNKHPMGLGCLQLQTINQSMYLIKRAYELGVRLFDTAAMYGTYEGENEELLGKSILQLSHDFNDKDFRNKIFISTKGGVTYRNGKLELCGDKVSLKKTIEDSFRRLQSDYIDAFYLHRIDPKVSIQESIATIAEYVTHGKIRYIGLSEVDLNTIQAAERTYPIHFIQNKFSPWYRFDELENRSNNIFSYCKDNNKIYVAYSPLARGFFTSSSQNFFQNLPSDDFRKKIPRYGSPHLEHNLSQRTLLGKISDARQIPLSTLTLAWILYKSRNFGFTLSPIPASACLPELEENMRALTTKLSVDERNQFDLACMDSQYIGSHLPHF